jgi:O-antigen ligase
MLSGGYGFYRFTLVFPVALLLILFILILNNKTLIPKFNKMNLFFLVISVLGFISLLNPLGGQESFLETFEVFFGFIIVILISSYFKNKSDFEKMIEVSSVVLFLLFIHALFQYITGERVNATYSNENRLATLFVLMSPFYFSKLKKNATLKNILLIIIISAITYLTESRINMIVISFMALDYFYFKVKYKFSLSLRYFIIIILSFSFIAFLYSIISLDGDIISNQLNNPYSSLRIRLLMIETGFEIFKENIIFGVGPGNLLAINPYTGILEPIRFHNHIINILATFGILGGIFFLYSYIGLIKSYFELKIRFSNFYLIHSLKYFLIIFIIVSNVPSSLFRYRPFYLIFGIYFALVEYYKKEQKF